MGEPTISLRRFALGHLSFLYEIDIPVVRLTFFILQGKSENGIALLNSVFPLGDVGLEGAIDGIEGGGGGESVCVGMVISGPTGGGSLKA